MPQLTDCLVTTVKNVSGGSMNLTFLPPHGAVLADDGEYSFDGDLVSAIRSKFANYAAGKRAVASLKANMEAGNLEVIKTPAPVLYDPTLDNTKVLKADNGVLYLADPCWLATSSSASV